METKLIKQIAPELALYQYNEIPVLELSHPIGTTKVSLQGAQLLSWRPTHTDKDVIWLKRLRGLLLKDKQPLNPT